MSNTKPIRYIMPGEKCFTATQIMDRFTMETGYSLAVTNVGISAKILGLDYVEVEVDAPAGVPVSTVKQRQYSVLDMPLIFNRLLMLAQKRKLQAVAPAYKNKEGNEKFSGQAKVTARGLAELAVLFNQLQFPLLNQGPAKARKALH